MAKYVCILHFTSPKHEIDTHAEVAVTAEGERDTLFQAKIPGKSIKKTLHIQLHVFSHLS